MFSGVRIVFGFPGFFIVVDEISSTRFVIAPIDSDEYYFFAASATRLLVVTTVLIKRFDQRTRVADGSTQSY